MDSQASYNGRNRTFFFGAYQGFRYSKVQDTNLLVPTAAQLAGDESGAPQIYNPFIHHLCCKRDLQP